MIGGLLKIFASLVSLLAYFVLSSILGEFETMQWIAPTVAFSLWLVLSLFAHVIEKLEKIERNTAKTQENIAYCTDYLEEIRNYLLNSNEKSEN